MSARALMSRYLEPNQFPVLIAAWRWWIGELAALVPTPMKKLLAGSDDRILLLAGLDGRTEIVTEAADRRRSFGFVSLATTVEGNANPLPASAMPPGRCKIVLRLPASAALRSTIALPASAQRNLDQAVSFELRRQTPFRQEDILHAFRIAKRDGKTIFVELTVVPRPAALSLASAAEAFGLKPTAIEVAPEDADQPVSPDLLSGKVRARPLPGPAIALAALSAFAFLLSFASIEIPLQRDYQLLANLEVEADRARHLADESLRLEKEIDARSREGGFLAERKRQVPAVSQILDDMTKLLPDDTWLVELRVEGRTVTLTGLTSSAPNVIGIFAKSGSFANPTFRSAVTQDQRSGHEQFDLAVQLAPAATP